MVFHKFLILVAISLAPMITVASSLCTSTKVMFSGGSSMSTRRMPTFLFLYTLANAPSSSHSTVWFNAGSGINSNVVSASVVAGFSTRGVVSLTSPQPSFLSIRLHLGLGHPTTFLSIRLHLGLGLLGALSYPTYEFVGCASTK